MLAACGSSENGASGTSATTAQTTPDAAETTEPTDAATTVAETTADGQSELSWEHVSFGFVSAFVLVRGREAAVGSRRPLATLAALEPEVAAFGHRGGPPITVDVTAQRAALAAG